MKESEHQKFINTTQQKQFENELVQNDLKVDLGRAQEEIM